ncbi:MAG: Cof-type HAD-IIB family hydrolase [Acutalibacteraceae bacterium]
MNSKIQLVALDLDGTLLNKYGQISDTDKNTLAKAIQDGIEIVISTGRPYIGLPVDVLCSIGIRYAITANGSAIYTLPDKKCIFENCIDATTAAGILERLRDKSVYFDAFIDGNGFSNQCKRHLIDSLAMPSSVIEYIRSTRTFVTDIAADIRQKNLKVQKMSIDFIKDTDGSLIDYETVRSILQSYPDIIFVSGGCCNAEVTKVGTTKGQGLRFIAEQLNIPMTATMACGDSENDINILQTAQIGVAMENAESCVKQAADFVTKSNNDNGVSYAIQKYIYKN